MPDAVVVDTSDRSIDEVVEHICELVAAKQSGS
jgi:cytidylate kinase